MSDDIEYDDGDGFEDVDVDEEDDGGGFFHDYHDEAEERPKKRSEEFAYSIYEYLDDDKKEKGKEEPVGPFKRSDRSGSDKKEKPKEYIEEQTVYEFVNVPIHLTLVEKRIAKRMGMNPWDFHRTKLVAKKVKKLVKESDKKERPRSPPPVPRRGGMTEDEKDEIRKSRNKSGIFDDQIKDIRAKASSRELTSDERTEIEDLEAKKLEAEAVVGRILVEIRSRASKIKKYEGARFLEWHDEDTRPLEEKARKPPRYLKFDKPLLLKKEGKKEIVDEKGVKMTVKDPEVWYRPATKLTVGEVLEGEVDERMRDMVRKSLFYTFQKALSVRPPGSTS